MDISDPDLARRILQDAPVIALILDPLGRVQYINPFGERLTGWRQQDLLGKDWFANRLPANDQARMRQRFLALLAGDPSYGAVNAVLDERGGQRMVDWRSQRLVDAHGQVSGLLSIGTDVTERLAAELTLRDRERRYQALFEANPQPMWVFDRENLRFLAVNEAAVARYGYDRSEFLAMGLADIRPAEDLPRLMGDLAQQGEGLRETEHWRHRLKDGSLIDVEVSVHGLLWGDRPACLVRVNDLTERRRAEQQRETLLNQLHASHAESLASRDLLKDVLERVDDGFVALDRQWHYTYLNSQAATLLGRQRPEDLLGRHIWTEFPEGVGQPFHQAYVKAMALQQPQVLEQHFTPWDRWFENRIYPSPNGLTIYFSDITARKQAEGVLRKSEELLRHFFESGLVGMAITVPSKHWGQFNQRLCDMLGYSAQQMQELTWEQITHPDDLAENLAYFEQVLAGAQEGYRMEKRYIRGDGSLLQAAISVRCERDEAGPAKRFFAIVEDIGARKRTEASLARQRDELEQRVQQRTAELMASRDEALRANQAKSQFLSRMSHELRTPLNAILGFGQLMAMQAALPSKHRDFVREILVAGRHLLALINEVLDLAHIESGRLSLSIERLTLADMLAEAVAMTQPLADQRGIRLDLEPAPGLAVQADRVRLRQVLLNLVGNAVKYNRVGGQVSLSAQAWPDAMVRLSVTDTGPGIADDRMGKLFQPFERLGAESAKVEGHGIGLSIARQLVELMGGQIGADGRPGQGAHFWVLLPGA